MALLYLRDSSTWVHDFDFTGAIKKGSLKVSVAELDVTPFAPAGGYRSRIGGLRDSSFSAEGYWDSPPDSSIFTNLGVADRAVTICPEGAETKTAYLLQAGHFKYEPFGQVGEVVPFRFDMMGTNAVGVVRGQMAKAKGNVAATGAMGSPLNLGAVGAAQFLYATVHIFTAATTITLQVQSDTTSGFAAPTVRATIGPLTTAGGTFMVRVPGSITDTWWRFNVSAITGTFTLAGAIGVGS